MKAAYASSESVEWYTPPEYIDAARKVLGTIDLDPASSVKANKTVQASRIYTAKDDGLSQPWSGRVWLNPPYAKGITGLWVKHLADECEAGRVRAAILLVNAAPDRSWFADVWRADLVCFTNHRIQFYRPGKPADQPVMGNAFGYWGPRREVFNKVFSDFGRVTKGVTKGGVTKGVTKGLCFCGNPLPPFEHKGRPAKSCSSRCRQLAYRMRRDGT